MYLGIDIGGSSIKFGIIDDKYKIIFKEIIEISPKSKKPIVEIINDAIASTQKNFKNIQSIGIGIPGIINNGKVIISPNIPSINGINFYEHIELKKKIPVAIDNDANAAALTELFIGVGKKLNSFIYVTLGTGVGGAIIHNREIFRGFDGSAGEIGHIIIDADIYNNEADFTTGTLEHYIGRQGIIRLFKEAVKNSIYSFDVPENVDVSDISEYADANECEALEALSKSGRYFGVGLASVMNLLGIPFAIVGGGISKINNIFYIRALETIKKRALPHIAKKAKILKAKFLNDTGIIGAAILGKQMLDK